MRTRIWATAAVVWAVLFLVLYFWRVHKDGNSPAWWYIIVVVAATLLTLPAAIIGPTNRTVQGLLMALGLFVITALVGAFTVGPVLIPAIIATGVAAKGAAGSRAQLDVFR